MFNGINGIQIGQQHHIGNLHDVKKPNAIDYHLMGGNFAFRLQLVEGNAVFHIMSTMLQLFELKGHFNGLTHEHPN